MKPSITTITPYWDRPEMLKVWLEAIRGATTSEVEHILFFVGDDAPVISNPPPGLRIVKFPRGKTFSIGHCHNMGARLANTEWIMKLDVDTLPSLMFFRELKAVMEDAGPREWFNCGMLYFKQVFTHSLLTLDRVPIGPAFQHMVCQNMRAYSANGYHLPAATNFICRTQDYLDLGGCDKRFHGYGWEDYQQIYMLERYQQAKDPLPGLVSLDNVTRRCRDEISRRKAKELFDRNETFCLFHRWHKNVVKDRTLIDKNRRVLYENVIGNKS